MRPGRPKLRIRVLTRYNWLKSEDTAEDPKMNAKSLARSFVRAVKIFSPDRYQGEEALGAGIYDYRVTVRDAGEKDLVIGVKMADQSDLVWTLPPSN